MTDAPETLSVLVAGTPDAADCVASALDVRADVDAVAVAADEAVASLETATHDCVVALADGTDALALLAAVREDHPTVPVVLATDGAGAVSTGRSADPEGGIAALEESYRPVAAGEAAADRWDDLADRVRRAVAAGDEPALDTLVGDLPALVYRTCRDGPGLSYVGGDPAALVGYPDDALLSGTTTWLADVVHPEDRERVRTARAAGDRPHEVSYRVQTPDGDVRWVWDHSRPADGGREGLVIDISGYREREQELERYETMVESVGDGVYAMGPDGEFTAVNEAMTELTGYTRDELLGETGALLAEGEALERARRKQAAVRSGEYDEVTMEITLRRADGSTVPIETRYTARRRDGEYRGVVGVARDISERKEHRRTITALHAATRDLMAAETAAEIGDVAIRTASDVLDLPHSGLFLLDEASQVIEPVASTEAATETYGPPPTFPVGEGIAGEAFAAGEEVVLDDASADERALPDGSRDIRSYCVIPLGDHGVFIVASPDVGAFDDREVDIARILAANIEAALTRAAREAELRDRERELARQNERLEAFASVVSHDLRNPLNVARGRLELARETEDDEHLGHVGRALDRMESLIKDLLTLARHGRDVEEPTVVDLRTVAETAWETSAPDAEPATLEVASGLGEVRADEERLRQAFENLFRNAVEHAGPDATVRVGPIEDGGFYVADDGPGIPPDERERVFEHGYSTAEAGTGFGLTIVRDIVQAHDWAVAVTEGESGGARFEVTGVGSRDDAE